jgi:peptide/nickel transport system substrate-binding protein
MHSHRVSGFCAALGIAASLAMAGPAMAGKADDTLNVGFSAEIATLDYYFGSGRNNLIMAQLVYDTLIYKDPATGDFIPALAESYEYLDDKTIEFTIRQGVKFHDGTTLDADDVVYTLNKMADPDYGVVYQIAVNWIDRAEKVGDNKVQLHMNRTYPVALEWLGGFLPIYPKDYYEKVGKEGMAVKPVGTGPYRIVEVTPGTHWKLERFADHYAGSPKGNAIGAIDIRVIPEANTQFTELLTDKLDFIWKFTPDQAERLAGRGNIDVKGTPILRVVYMQPNLVDDSPMKDERVRKAINYAINRQAIMEAFVGQGAEVVSTPCNPVQFGCYDQVTSYPYDPAKAKALLAEAGYPKGFSMKLLVSQSPSSARPVAEAILTDLNEIGVSADIELQQYAAAREKWIGGGYPLIFMSWGSWGIGDVAMFTSEFFGGGDVDKVRDPEIVEHIKTADGSVDRAVREENYAEVMKKVAAEAYWVPLWTYAVNYATSKDLDFTLDADEIARFFNAKWK